MIRKVVSSGWLGKGLVVAAVFLPIAELAIAQNGLTLKTIKERGAVLCGVSPGRHGFSSPNSKGQWTGLDVDFCRAVTAAVFGDAGKVKYVPTTGPSRFPALQSGEVDLLSRVTSINLTRDAAMGMHFGPPTFYTGTGFMVRKDLGVGRVDDLDGAAVCVLPGSTTEKNVSAVFRSKGLSYKPIVIGNSKELASAYLSGRCDVLAMDQAGLAGQRQYVASNPDEHMILDGIFSKEPLALAVRHGDDQWYDITKWVVHATINAEELGITRANVDEQLRSKNPDIARLLGVEGRLGEKLGIDNAWAYNVIKQVGNYGEIYDRNFGPASPLKLPRGPNALWTDGGLMYGYPIQ